MEVKGRSIISNKNFFCKINLNEEQHVCVKFCIKQGKTFTETFQMFQEAFGDECFSLSRCYDKRTTHVRDGQQLRLMKGILNY